MVNNFNTPAAFDAFCGLNQPIIQAGISRNSNNNSTIAVVVVVGVILVIGISVYLINENKQLQVMIKKMKEDEIISRAANKKIESMNQNRN